MKYLLPSLLAIASTQVLSAASVWYEGQVLGLRTDATTGFVFDGAPASIADADMNGSIDDGLTNFYSAINVDVEGTASINLAGDNFDWAFRFQFYDADGIFGFTENFDDSVRVNATPIVGNTDLTPRGAAGPTHQDADAGTSWNTRTYGNFDFSGTAGGGWFDITVDLDENAGGAQSAGGIGFGFFNGNSTTDADFGGIGYAGGAGQVTFDADPASGASFGVLTVPEPSASLMALLGALGLAFRRRK